jgi:hypothetical protein
MRGKGLDRCDSFVNDAFPLVIVIVAITHFFQKVDTYGSAYVRLS